MTNRTAPADMPPMDLRIGDQIPFAYSAEAMTAALAAARAESAGMAECMETVRADLIAAGVIGQDVPPMMVAEAVVKAVKEARRKALEEAAKLLNDRALGRPASAQYIRAEARYCAELIRALIPNP